MAVNKDNYQNPLEEQEHLALVDWLTKNRICFYHPPNEGMHKVQYLRKRKKLGVLDGMVDILIFDTPPFYPELKGAAIELKRRKGGVVSREQVEWMEALKNRGWAVAVCNGAGEALGFLRKLGYHKARWLRVEYGVQEE